MPERRPGDDSDHAWLLARERGEPGPTIPDARAGRYAQLGALLADLPAMPAGVTQRDGWEQGVLALIDADAGQLADPSRTPPATDKPLPAEPTARRRRWRAATAAVFVMAASVAIVAFLRDRREEAPVIARGLDGSNSSTPNVEVTRGGHVEPGRLGFDHAVQVRRSATAVPHELRDGDTVLTGDSIRASVMTTADAYLYLAFCKDQHLQVHPSQGGVRTRAGDLVLVPEGGGDLVLDDHPGSEVLYLIVSRSELSLADPQLAALLFATGDRAKAVDCGTSLDSRLMKSTAVLPPSNVLRGERYPADGPGSPGAVVAADADGIAIVRYRFIHVASGHAGP